MQPLAPAPTASTRHIDADIAFDSPPATVHTAIRLPTADLARNTKETVPEFVVATLSSPTRVHRSPVFEQRAGYEKAPDLSENAPPDYPPEAISRGLQGVVWLRLFIDDEGDVRVVKLLKSSGHGLLDNAAIHAVKTWSGTPAERGGRPVDTLEVLPIRFRL